MPAAIRTYDIALFDRLMDEIDKKGNRQVALHKDGEPLLHPQITYILNRIKKYQNHAVYLTTNAHRLSGEIAHAIIDNRIDIVNFSIGAYSENVATGAGCRE